MPVPLPEAMLPTMVFLIDARDLRSSGVDEATKTDDRRVVVRQHDEIIVAEHAGPGAGTAARAAVRPRVTARMPGEAVGQTIPRSLARATVPVRDELPSFDAADESLVLIEDSERCNSSAISRLDFPRDRRCNTSCSPGVSSSTRDGPAGRLSKSI